MSAFESAQTVATLSERLRQATDEIAALRAEIAALRLVIQSLLLREADRAGFFRGMKMGAQALLVAMGAIVGGGASKLIAWLGGQ